MTATEQARFDELYNRHLRTLKLRGMSGKTIDSYARAVRRVSSHFDCCPDQLTIEQLENYFAQLVDSHSWSLVKIDRNGLQFFWKYVLKTDWQWLNIIKAPKVLSLPDILTLNEVERLILATHQLRYRVFLLTTYSMGLRLSETLALQVGDIDTQRKQVHIRRGKGHKDRFVPPAGSDLSRLTVAMEKTSQSLLAVSECAWLHGSCGSGDYSHGSGRYSGRYESRCYALRH